MTNKKSTKRALLTSAMSMLLCVSMLIGSTFAWFTDSATSANNKIVAGNLDIELLMHDGTDYKNISTSKSPIFGEGSIAQNNNAQTLWEPGKTQVAYLAIKNAGNLDLKYNVNLIVKNVAKDLYKAMEYAIIPDAQYKDGTVTGWTDGNTVNVGSQLVSNGDVSLASGLTHYFALAIHMDEEAGNEYQEGQVDFDIVVNATQLNSEKDSFGPDYDVEATIGTLVSNGEELADAITTGGNVVLAADAQFAAPIKNDVVIDLADNTFEATGSYTLSNNADFTMSNGEYVVNKTYGHVDVRPDSAEGSVVTFEGVDFTSNYKNKTYGTCTDRLVSVVEVTPDTADGHVVAVFRNCTFDNAKVLFEGMSGKIGSFEAIFENCTFNALTSSSPIEVMNYIEGTITVKNCTFNLKCTSSSAAAICVSPSSSTSVTINAEKNTINAVAATPYTYDAAAGETEADNIKVFGTPKNIRFISSYENTTVTETNTVKKGIAG